MTPRKKSITFGIITIVAAIGATLILQSSNRSLVDYKMMETTLTSAHTGHMREDMSKSPYAAFIFTVNNAADTFAVVNNAHDYSNLEVNLHTGDNIKMWYQDFKSFTMEGYNDAVVQINKNDKAILDIAQINDANRKGAWLFFGIAAVFLVMTIVSVVSRK